MLLTRVMLTLGLLGALAAPARALESRPVTSEHVTATLVSDTDAVAAGTSLRVGLRLRMAPGWHTYWRNSGDAGAPTELDLTLPASAHAGTIAWPAPRLLTEGQLATYGYTGEVLLPVTITPGAGAAGMSVAAHGSWLVCNNICVPEEGDFSLALPAGPYAPSAEATLFAEADRAVPQPTPFTAIATADGTLSLTGAGLSAQAISRAHFFPDDPGAIIDAAPQTLSVRDGRLTLALKPGEKFAAGPLSGVLEIADASGMRSALQIAAPHGAAPFAEPPEDDAPPMPWLHMLGLAFLGGLVLNLMPCVFPILAMKAVSIIGMSGAERGEVRAESLSYTGGVVIAFAALGAALLGFRYAGAAVGWGFQFQSPVFVAGVTWLLFGVGLSLSGVFHIGASLCGAGHHLASKDGHMGSFFTGLLAVLVATPCTAPFMGAAVAAALAAPPAVTMAVFVALGLGLAAPYLLLAAVPGIAHLAPRPGHWMEVFKQVLAFPMYAACVWLVWVISQEAGPAGVLATLAGLVLVGFAGWAYGTTQHTHGVWRRFGQVATLAGALAAVVVLVNIATAAPMTQGSAEAERAPGEEKFTAARLAALRAEGRPVFVNMTAAWCVTCLVNEHVAIGTAAVRQALSDGHVAYLKGDWTQKDKDITEFLRAHGRDGVPLYVFFPANGREPVVLPQILTVGTILNGLASSGA